MASRKLEVVFVGDTKQLEGAFKRAGGAADAAESKWSKMGKALRTGVVAGGTAAAAGLGKSISAATDLGEEISKAGVVFRGHEKDLVSWSKTTAKSLGISQRAALQASGTFGNMLVPMGFARKEAAGMSKRMVGLAADMASFNNASPEETLDALRAGLAGETEPLRKFGVFLNDARLKQEALNMGIYKGKGPLDAQAKAQATYSLILKDSKDAQGDFARTSDSLANRQRILKAQAENLAASLGTFLIPMAQKVAGWAEKLAAKWDGTSASFKRGVVIAGGVLVALTPIVLVAAKVAKAASTLAAGVAKLWPILSKASLVVRGLALAIGGPWLLAIGAAVAAGVLLYKNWDVVVAALGKAWDWAKGAATSAFGAISGVVTTTWDAIKDATTWTWNAIKAALSAVWGAIKFAATTYFNAYKTIATKAWDAIKGATTLAWGAIKASLSAVWGAIRTAATTYFNAYKSIATGVWDAIKGATSLAWGAIKSSLSLAWGAIRTTARTAWNGIRAAVVDPFDSAVDRIGSMVGSLKDKISGGFKWIREAASDLGGALKDRIVDSVRGAANAVLDFVNKILGVVDKIPGVSVGRIKGLAQGGSFSRSGVQALAQGGLVSKPTVVMGEEAPRHPEYVIPTNPAYRSRALMLLSNAARALGVDAPAIPPSAAHGAVRAAMEKHSVGGLPNPLDLPGKVAGLAGDGLDLLLKGPGALLKLLPNPADMLPGWIQGLGKWTVAEVGKWIKKKVGDLVPGGGGGGGGSTMNPLGGAPGSLQAAMAIARRFGLTITSTTGGKHAPGSWHYQGRAFDASNGFGPTPQMMGFARYMASTMGSRLLELFYDPLGWSVKNGQRAGFTVGGHSNHVHVAMAQGGVAPGGFVRVGELGAEWAQLPAGTRVMQASESAGFTPGGGGPLIGELHVHERVDERVLARELAWAVAT